MMEDVGCLAYHLVGRTYSKHCLSVANSLFIVLLFGVTVVPEYRFNPSLDVWLAISETRILDRAMVRSSGLRRGGDVNAVTRKRVCDQLCRSSFGCRRVAEDRNDSGFYCCHHNWAIS